MEKVNFLYKKKRQKIVVGGAHPPHGQASQGTPSVRIPSKKQKKYFLVSVQLSFLQI